MAWTTKSSVPHFFFSSANAASIEPWLVTSQSISAAGFSGATSGTTRFLKTSP